MRHQPNTRPDRTCSHIRLILRSTWLSLKALPIPNEFPPTKSSGPDPYQVFVVICQPPAFRLVAHELHCLETLDREETIPRELAVGLCRPLAIAGRDVRLPGNASPWLFDFKVR